MRARLRRRPRRGVERDRLQHHEREKPQRAQDRERLEHEPPGSPRPEVVHRSQGQRAARRVPDKMRACAVVMSTDSWWLTRVAAALALIALACATAETRAPVDTRAAAVDMKRAMRECREGRAAREELMKDFRASQATLDKQQEDLVRRMQVFKQHRDRGLQPPDDEATLKRDLAALQDLYRQLQKRLTDEEAR